MIATAPNEIIAAQGLSKWFGEVMAVNNLEVSIGRGVTGLLGPNGAGKTTFIRLALGLYAPSRGHIHLFGQPPRNNLDVLNRIAYCPEIDRFYENMSGCEFVQWMNRLSGFDKRTAKRRAEEACEMVKMTHRMRDPINTYSRGMRQRIKVAQALANDPELLFLDEPMSGLDPEAREDIFSIIRHLGESGRTVIFSTHVLHEVERVTSNVLLLHNGCILAQGDIREIRALIDEHPHAITVTCADPHALSREFVHEPATLSIEFLDGSVTVRTRDPNAVYQRLNDMALNGQFDIEAMTCPDDNLQSVFEYLIK